MDGNGVSRQEMKPMPAPPSKLCWLVFALQGAEDTHGAIDGCPMTNDGDVPQPQSAWRFGCRFCQRGILSEEDVRESHDFEKHARGKMEFPQKSLRRKDRVVQTLMSAAVARNPNHSHPPRLTCNPLHQFQFNLLIS